MGNRIILQVGAAPSAAAIYVHELAGLGEAYAWLVAARRLGLPDPEGDPSYSAARLLELIARSRPGLMGLGVAAAGAFELEDEGLMILGPGFTVAARELPGGERLSPAQLASERAAALASDEYAAALAQALGSAGAGEWADMRPRKPSRER